MFFGYGLLAALKAYYDRNQWPRFTNFRMDVLHRRLLLSAMQCDYQQYEKQETQNLLKRADRALSGSFLGGMGAFYADSISLGVYTLNLIIYSILLSNVSFWMILLVFILAALHYLIYRLCYIRFNKAISALDHLSIKETFPL